jgi:threonine dehydrogenase-like Zn-dependent dehydrogenase
MLIAQGLKVVGVDIRDGPLALARSLKLQPDLLLHAGEVTAEEGAKLVERIRPDGWDRGPGCDGQSRHSLQLDLSAHTEAVVNLNTSEAGLVYPSSLVRNHGTLILTAGPPKVTFSILDFIFKQLNVFGTQNGSGQDLREAIELCTEHSIRSTLRLYKLEEGSLRDMVESTHDAEWSGKAVVVV